MAYREVPFTDITFDVANDSTDLLLTTGHKLTEAKAAIIEAEALVANALEQRVSYITGVHRQLTQK